MVNSKKLGKPLMPGSLKNLIKVAITCIFLLMLVWKVDVHKFLKILKNIDENFFSLAIFSLFFQVFIASYRWQLLNVQILIRQNFLWHLRTSFGSIFFGQIFFSVLGADAFRIYSLRKEGADIYLSASSVLADRMIGLSTLVIFSYPHHYL